MFNQYRIPRENLLNRTADVTADGAYESSFSDPSKILGAALENLSAGRIGIMQESCHSISSAVAIAVRYAATRAQFGERDEETPLIEYPLHSEAVSEIHAMVSCSKPLLTWITLEAAQQCREACGGHGFLKRLLTWITLEAAQQCREACGGYGFLKQAAAHVDHAASRAAVPKPLLTWITLEAAQQCREACGGHGFLKQAAAHVDHAGSRAAVLRGVQGTWLPEGDNNVLSQQTGNWLLRQYELASAGNEVDSPLGTVAFLKDFKSIMLKKFSLRERAVEGRAQVRRARQVSGLQVEGAHESVRRVSSRYILPGSARQEREGIAAGAHEAVLFVWTVVACVVDALAPTDFVLNSVLGKSDGKLYQNLQKAFFTHPGAFERAPWWQQVVNAPPSKL
ncbi:Peroxisomal acyl-CoA oxidase, partial [Operophtera brumata]